MTQQGSTLTEDKYKLTYHGGNDTPNIQMSITLDGHHGDMYIDVVQSTYNRDPWVSAWTCSLQEARVLRNFLNTMKERGKL